MKSIFYMIILFSTLNNDIIFDFTENSDLNNWRIVNDGVMGGKSSSTFKLNASGYGVFQGDVSLENNGGFASVRHVFHEKSVKGFTTVNMRLKGDGKNFQFRLKSNAQDDYSYIIPFETSGKWQNIEILLEEMYPSFRGRKLSQPNFNHDSIEEIAILIGNKKQESFKLQIDKITLK